jgi:Flp pilus assembly protein TadB
MYFRTSKNNFYLLKIPFVKMRFTTTQLYLILILTLAIFTPAFAVITNKTTHLSTEIQQSSLSHQASKVQKQVLKIQKFLKKRDINFTHPTDKWLWFGLCLLGASVIMNFIPVVRIFASLISLVGVVFIFIWLFKKFV